MKQWVAALRTWTLASAQKRQADVSRVSNNLTWYYSPTLIVCPDTRYVVMCQAPITRCRAAWHDTIWQCRARVRGCLPVPGARNVRGAGRRDLERITLMVQAMAVVSPELLSSKHGSLRRGLRIDRRGWPAALTSRAI